MSEKFEFSEEQEKEFLRGMKEERTKIFGEGPGKIKSLIFADMGPVSLSVQHLAWLLSDLCKSFKEECKLDGNHDQNTYMVDMELSCLDDPKSIKLQVDQAFAKYQEIVKRYYPDSLLSQEVYLVRFLIEDDANVVMQKNAKAIKRMLSVLHDYKPTFVVVELMEKSLHRREAEGLKINNIIFRR